MEHTPTALPRVTIQFCTQCKWMLRAAYFAQELLSTFSTSLGEVALQPSTGGTFIVTLYHASPSTSSSADDVQTQKYVLWDRKTEGGFPETKELKRRVRDVIDPKRDLGHVDGKKSTTNQPATETHEALSDNTKAIPKAISNLQESSASASTPGERKFTPMDIDPKSRDVSLGGGELVNERGKVVITGEVGDGVFCKPGEDCEDCG